jgi:molybdopterin-guanine dinucleotide biosynthesis protein A
MSKKLEIPAVIFAGGKSSRMKRDKALLPFGAYKTLVEYQFERLQKIFKDVYISWKTPKVEILAQHSIFDLQEYSEVSAPIVALYSVMKKLENEKKIFVLSVDSPFFSEEAICKLVEKSEKNLITSPTLKGKYEPLLSVYSTSLIQQIENKLQNGEYKLNSLFTKAHLVEFENENLFTNMNFYNEYTRHFEMARKNDLF